MRYKTLNFLIFVFACVVGLSSQATPSCDDYLEGRWPAQEAPTSGGAIAPHAKSYGDAARAAGLRFVMRLVPPRFILNALEEGGVDFGSGAPVRLQKSAYDRPLIPLFDHDHGAFIQHTIAASTSRRNGFEEVKVNEWFVGVIYPVEILDFVPFQFSGKANPHEIGAPEEMSSETVSPESFGKIVQWMVDHPTWENSGFPSWNLQIHADSDLPLKRSAMLWIPAPLLRNFGGSRLLFFPGLGDPDLPRKDESFFVQIGKYDPDHPRANGEGWVQVKPEGNEFTLPWLDASLRIGTWYKAMPNWKDVEMALAKQAQLR